MKKLKSKVALHCSHMPKSAVSELLDICSREDWLANMLMSAFSSVSSSTAERAPLKSSGIVKPVVVKKPWGLEIIGPVVRQQVGSATEGYAQKILVVSGSLSLQAHYPYKNERGKLHHAKVESQTVLYGELILGLGQRKTGKSACAKKITLKPGQTYHIAAGTVHQPMSSKGGLAIILEVSLPNVGPGSTRRIYDPWNTTRSRKDM